jgi:phage-related protein
MLITSHSSVEDFISSLDKHTQEKAHRLMQRLEIYGKELEMPHAKPIGSGLWELRIRGHSAIRILYGFCGGQAVLLLAFKKQNNAIKPEQFKLAQQRLKYFA